MICFCRCMVLVVLSVMSLILDLIMKERKQPLMSVPSWKLFLGANMVICFCLKLVISMVSTGGDHKVILCPQNGIREYLFLAALSVEKH